MLLPYLMLGDRSPGQQPQRVASPLAHAHLRPYINPARAQGMAVTGMQLSGAGFLPGLSREAGDRLHCIRAVTTGGEWDRVVRTLCEKEAPIPGLSMGNLNLRAQGAPKPVNLGLVHP